MSMEVKRESVAVTPSLEFPRIEKFKCYRRYLEAFYSYKKSLRAGFSFRQFSALAGLKSPNYLQLVIKGERNLSSQIAEQVASAMKLTPHETSYFLSLVQQENARTDDELREAEKEGLAALKKLVAKQVPSLYAEVVSRWHHLVVREMSFLPDFEPTGEYIARQTRGMITADQGELSLSYLIKAGFLVEREGRWQTADPVIDTGEDTFTHVHMQALHAETLRVWSDHIGEYDPRLQELGVLNIPMAAKKIPEFKERIRRFQDEIIGWLQSETEPDAVVQLGTYLMPLVVPPLRKPRGPRN
jgi:uncharacterized protein (TIGR02147 family)